MMMSKLDRAFRADLHSTSSIDEDQPERDPFYISPEDWDARAAARAKEDEEDHLARARANQHSVATSLLDRIVEISAYTAITLMLIAFWGAVVGGVVFGVILLTN